MRLMNDLHAIFAKAVMGEYDDVGDVLALTPGEPGGPRVYIFVFNLPEDTDESEAMELNLLGHALAHVARRWNMDREEFLEACGILWEEHT